MQSASYAALSDEVHRRRVQSASDDEPGLEKAFRAMS